MRMLKDLKDVFRGRPLLLVSCGPTATHWRKVRSGLPDNALIGCVKQAIFLCKKEAELHFFNAFNCQRYFPYNRNTLRVFVADEESPINFNPADLTFELDPSTCTSLETSVAGTGDFESYTIERAGRVKPWGPGIVYEIVVYLALHLGIREIHTIGWDVAREPLHPKFEQAPLNHFYDSKRDLRASFRDDFEWLSVNPSAYATKAFLKHIFGQTYNRMPHTDRLGEVPMIVKSLPSFFSWVDSIGISIKVHTALGEEVIDPRVRSNVIDLTNRF
jgi:hypothetical protein